MDFCRSVMGIMVILFFVSTVRAQERYTLSGTVTEANTNETLIGVSIIVTSLNRGTATNQYGFYSLTLPEGTYEVTVSAIGLGQQTREVVLDQDRRVDFKLEEMTEELEEVVLTENVEKINLRAPQMSVNALSSQTIKEVPVVLGESDVIKSLLLLPGVSSGGEAASGFNVRGGAADQNLILLDEAIIFNSSHLFGFFSVFNPDAIKDIRLYKGSIPARYGGRLSSVLEIYQKEGNSNRFQMNGGIGAVASRLLAEGPIVKEKGAFLLGGRASYAHLFLPLLDIDNAAYFYDLNTKLNYRIDNNNSLFISGYFGRDKFSLDERFVNTYGNSVFNLRWNHLFSNKLFSNLSLIYSDYYYGLILDFVGFQWDSGIRNANIKYDLKHYISDRFQLNYGVNNIYYAFNPGKIEPNRPDSGIIEDQIARKYANEFAAYIGAEHDINDKLSLQYGIRISHFTRLGQEEFFVYENDNPLIYDADLQIYREAEPVDTLNLSRSESLKSFMNIEPRFSLSYILDDNTSVKASVTRVAQYLHLLSNTNSPTPLDVWTPSGPYIKPQLGTQYAMGYFKRIFDDFSLETEVFYKNISNRIDYVDGADLIANEAVERVILNGRARAYGLEVLLRKESGRLNGWLSYTLSRSEQRTPGRSFTDESGTLRQETGINNGEWYLTPFDKTHDIAVYGNYELNKRWSFNANFIFQTGQPTNYPEGQFEFQGVTVPYFGARNSQRLPSYHRLDIAAVLKPAESRNKKWKSEWVFSIYNAYNRMNAASINFRRNQDTGVNEAVKTSIFGIVPSVTYNFKF
ncbi:TonB-dependent receptor [Robertkochia aurantiaca]|uniref:TonB-dependent receptor n=1 Tax=Robertkochia aurantiaca TaxID=2873700 RepID=UPI001CCA9507|nr:TonB-dependent receptor [Robertkochia sp. 3YJGBD-33]